MASLLLNKVINGEISSKLLIKWLLKAIPENDDDFKDIFDCKVGQIDFVTYFLNFIHEEVPCCNKSSETPQNLNTPKRIDKVQIHIAKENSKVFRTNLFQDQNTSFNASLDNSVGKISTPRNTKAPEHKDDSYFSPISPLYQNPKQNNANRKSADKHSLCLGDFLITSSKSSSKKKRQSLECADSKKETSSRRIKPTSICLKQVNNGFGENSFNFQENVQEVPVKTVAEQRNLLVEERLKVLTRKTSIDSPVMLKRHNSLTKSDVKPMLSMVTYKTNINYVVDIYKTLLNHKLLLNLTSEIYFLISLFLSKQPENKQSSRLAELNQDEDFNLGVDVLDCSSTLSKPLDSNEVTNLHNLEIFETVHNIVYFAVKCLETQLKIIQFYDKTTIRLLAENDRLSDYSPVLSKKLLACAEKKTEKSCTEPITPILQINNVCFNIDTDNRENFPDILSFQAFRKQRDLFYEILRVWETHHLATDWNFSLGLGGKIRSLFNYHSGPTNHMHLARLFKNQLLSSCAKGPKEKGLSQYNLSFLPSLAIDADKLNRLTNRLVTKQASNGINSLPVFSGYQEFFKEFVVVSKNYLFNKHLCDSIVSEIIELNETKFSDADLEQEEGNNVDINTRKLYIDSVKNLRILAKFLGFIESLPYQTDTCNLPKNVLEAQIKLRQTCIPTLNIKSLLETSIEKHTVVLLVPWLTKYLAMLDYVALRLPYYMAVHSILFDLYQNYETSGMHPEYNAAVVKFCLGWLFELPHFPDGEYFNYCSKLIDTKPSAPCQNGISERKSNYLDHMAVVNQSVLYLCCPYLEEIKKVLSTNAPGSKIAVKYITPVTAIESNSQMARKKLEQQLEEAFFSGQPTSLRKTIEFISERIASTAVKYICYDLVPKAKESAVKELRETLLKSDSIENYGDDNQRKVVLRKQAAALSQSHLSKFLQTCDEETQIISDEKIPACIEGLLPIDTLDETKRVCISITKKMYAERVKYWINSHVNLAVFTKDFDSEIQKKITNNRRIDKEKTSFSLPGSGRDCDHNENTFSGFHVLNNIREACCNIIENPDTTLEYVLEVLQETYKSLTQRNDVNDTILATVSMTAFDFCLLLVSGFPSIFVQSTHDLLNHFLNIWSLNPKFSGMFKGLFCPRNVNMLQNSSRKEETWDLYARIISRLLDRKLIEEDELESQCTGFYNRNWDKETLESFSHFLKNLVIYTNRDGTDKFAFLLDFLSDFCSDL